ncbi:uncharacterized protein LOC111048992 isoform X1 [Nilaparvata lugens]|uniref:uncharacterized protein LOC111048992 isoform X1 n=1 Tax=Nilaparvata lugens TaxID=108931 RepID=UPI00193CFAD0|nr:uncharacterized protein LOC111048992 isoform X1 [Nilaparvata lugens]
MSKNSHDEEKEFESLIRGLEKANIKFYKFSMLVLYPGGPWMYYNYIILFVFEIVSAYFLITGVITIYLQKNDIFVTFEVANAFLIFFAVFVSIADFHGTGRKRRLWGKLFVYFEDECQDYDSELIKKEKKRLRMVCRTNMKWFFIFSTPCIFSNIFFIFVVIPIIRFMIGEEQTSSDTAYNVYLPMPFWSVFNTRTFLGFSIQYMLMLFMVCDIFAMFLVYVSSVFYFFMEIIIQLKILSFALSKHDERVMTLSEANAKATELDECVDSGDNLKTKILKEPIIHHLKIREFFNMFQEFSSFFFGLVISVNMLVIVSLSVIITKMDSLLTLEGLKFCSVLILEILHMFCFTYCGSALIEESQNVRKSLYNIHWYNFNSNQKKIVNIFQMQTAAKFLLTASGIYGINLNTFLQVMQTAYSIINVLSNMKT